MIPDTTPFSPTVREYACADCDGPLGANRLRCNACVRAAQAAVAARKPGEVVRPSDVAAHREG